MPDPYRTVPAATGRTRATRLLVTGVFLVAVAAFESVGFRLSYEALHRVAVDNAVPEHSAWMFPVLVDGGIVLGSIGVVRALAGRRSTRPYWIVTVGFTLVSWGFNVSNAPKTAGGWAVATVAPLAQMVALEMGMQELRALLLQQPGATAQAPAAAPVPAAAPRQHKHRRQHPRQHQHQPQRRTRLQRQQTTAPCSTPTTPSSSTPSRNSRTSSRRQPPTTAPSSARSGSGPRFSRTPAARGRCCTRSAAPRRSASP
ncbi:DUF2637 domain-containing protein [Streptomyces sp. NPDC086782]|uniref:DUF2637 domain-containing protein n=1 Tax=Streptomyces sp. NPDC086782 TaxID=3365757 RepID=UPI00382F4860